MEDDILMIKVVSSGNKLTVDVKAEATTVVMLGMIARARIALDEIEDAVKADLKNDPKVNRS